MTVNIAKTKNKQYKKQCAALGCTNYFYGIANRKYCNDPRCSEIRKLIAKSIPRKIMRDPTVENLILKKSYLKKIKKGQVLSMRCHAKDCNGKRCCGTFLITYDPKRETYPKFCKDHRSTYRRHRFSIQRGLDAKNVSSRTY